MIPPEVKTLFGSPQLCWMATTDASGVPNVAPMRQVWWTGPQSLVIGDMFMKVTAANIQSNGRMCLGAYDPQSECSWKLMGKGHLRDGRAELRRGPGRIGKEQAWKAV